MSRGPALPDLPAWELRTLYRRRETSPTEVLREVFRRIDANEGWDVETAVNILRELRKYEIVQKGDDVYVIA